MAGYDNSGNFAQKMQTVPIISNQLAKVISDIVGHPHSVIIVKTADG
jgi:hypothetical protein